MDSILDQRIVRLRKYGERLTCREIAEDLGIRETRIYSALRRAGLQWQHRGMDKRTRAGEPASRGKGGRDENV